jgi:hypothetical protein
MKKIKLNSLYVALFASLVLFSCDNDVDQDYVLSGIKATATMTADKTNILESDDPSTATVDESVVNVTLTMDKPYKTLMKYKLEFLGSESTGTLDDIKINLEESPIDFGSAGYLIEVPAYSTSVTFSISGVLDLPAEVVENFKFRVYPVGDLDGAINSSTQYLSFTLGNSISDSLKITFDWNGDAEYIGEDNEVYNLSEFDFDLEIYDSAFNIVATSYSSSPEEIDFDSSEADGTYFIVPSFYTVAAVQPVLPINFTPKVTVSKPGVFTREFDLSGVWNSTIGGDQQGNPDAYNLLAYFVKSTVGGEAMYSLYDADDNLLVSGRFANIKSLLGSKSKKARK